MSEAPSTANAGGGPTATSSGVAANFSSDIGYADVLTNKLISELNTGYQVADSGTAGSYYIAGIEEPVLQALEDLAGLAVRSIGSILANVGTRIGSASVTIRTVTSGQFNNLKDELMVCGTAEIPAARYGYSGSVYERVDGSIFGLRNSSTGPVIDVFKDPEKTLNSDYKVHMK